MRGEASQHRVGAQAEYLVRMEWGGVGAQMVSSDCEFVVIVDVLSFTTTLTVACDLGIEVVPCPWRDKRAETLARVHGATLAVGRSQAAGGEVSLSPGTLRTALPMQRLVLPSPNGSSISSQLAEFGPQVLGASLRNRTAAATWLTEKARSLDRLPRVAVIASGERWPDGTLRPAIEDLWGAGAVIRALLDQRWSGLSPEAETAVSCFDAISGNTPAVLHRCVGGVELNSIGFGCDIDVAAEVDQSSSVPALLNGIFKGQPNSSYPAAVDAS